MAIVQTMTLTEFLLARIAEDEATARSGFSHPERWVRVAVPGTSISLANGLSCTAVLAECNAKRRIVDVHPLEVHPEDIPYDEWDGVGPDQRDATHCARCVGWGDGPYGVEDCTPACPTLLALAQPYAGHPDFDPAWRL